MAASRERVVFDMEHFALQPHERQVCMIFDALFSGNISQAQIDKLAKTPGNKRKIRSYILNQKDPLQGMLLLLRALDPCDTFGRFFWVKRFEHFPALEMSNLKYLYAEFIKLYANPELKVLADDSLKLILPKALGEEVEAYQPKPRSNPLVNIHYFSEFMLRNSGAERSAILNILQRADHAANIIWSKVALLPRNDNNSITILMCDYLHILEDLLDHGCDAVSIKSLLTDLMTQYKSAKYAFDIDSVDFPYHMYANFVSIARKLKLQGVLLSGVNRPIHYGQGHGFIDDSFTLKNFHILGTKISWGNGLSPTRAKILFNLLVLGRINDHYKNYFADHQHSIRDYIASLPILAERQQVLEMALDSNSALGKYFNEKKNFAFIRADEKKALQILLEKTVSEIAERKVQVDNAAVDVNAQRRPNENIYPIRPVIPEGCAAMFLPDDDLEVKASDRPALAVYAALRVEGEVEVEQPRPSASSYAQVIQALNIEAGALASPGVVVDIPDAKEIENQLAADEEPGAVVVEVKKPQVKEKPSQRRVLCL